MEIVIVGGGASGLVAAIEAAKGGATVRVLEKMNKPGKKILVTGNGKCNLTNAVQKKDCYRSSHDSDFFSLIQTYGYSFTKNYFEQLGVLTIERNGYVYPASGQAETIVNALVSKAEAYGVEFLYSCSVTTIEQQGNGFQVTYKTDYDKIEQLCCDKVVLSTGGKAAPKQGSDGSGYQLSKQLGHHIVDPKPSLVALHSDENYLKQLAGVRVNGNMTLYIENEKVSQECGELQLTAYGLSGVAIFQLSRFAVDGISNNKNVIIAIDLFPSYSKEQLHNLLKQTIEHCYYKTVEQLLDGIMNWKLSNVFVKQLKMPSDLLCTSLSNKQLDAIVCVLKEWKVPITGYNDFEQAQVTQGGVDLSEINLFTMESKIVNNLYFCGEILDVDGTCGGYNLQWAWATGYVAGRESAGVES